MRQRDRIKAAAEVVVGKGCTLLEIVNTWPGYCQTIRPEFPGMAKFEEAADVLARAFDAQAVIRGQARRSFAKHNMKRWNAITDAVAEETRVARWRKEQ